MENELQRLLRENASLKERNLVLESLPESAKVPPKAPLLNVPAMNTPMMTPPTYQFHATTDDVSTTTTDVIQTAVYTATTTTMLWMS